MPNNSQLALSESSGPQGVGTKTFVVAAERREKAGPSNLTNCTLRDATLGSPKAEKTVANGMDALAPGVRTGVFLGSWEQHSSSNDDPITDKNWRESTVLFVTQILMILNQNFMS